MVKRKKSEETLNRFAGRTLVDYARGDELKGMSETPGWDKDKAYAFIVSQMCFLVREGPGPELVAGTRPLGKTEHRIYAFDLRKDGGMERYNEVLGNAREITTGKLAHTVIEEVVEERIKNEISGRGKKRKETPKWGYFITRFKK